MRLKKRGGLNAFGKQMMYGRPGRFDAEQGLIRHAEATKLRSAPVVAGRRPTIPSLPRGERAGSAALAVATRPGARLGRLLPMALLAGAAFIVAAAVFGVLALTTPPKAALAQGERVFFDGRALCVVKSPDVARSALARIQDELKKSYGMDIQHNGALTFSPVLCDSQNILGEEDVLNALKANIDTKVMASVILVNDRPSVALRTAEEAQQALDAVLTPYRDAPEDRYRTGIAFVENVKVEQMPINYSQVQEVEDAVRALTLGSGVDDNYYTVKKGDSLARIAKEFSLKVSDIKKANPALSVNEVIHPGQMLNAVKPENWLNVKYTETVTREEKLPFETVEQPDASLYTTQKKTQQEGKEGKREVIAKVTYINGMEAEKEILSQTVLSAAQNCIVLRGTKKVPTNTNTGGSVSSGSFMKPLKSYTVTSTFGPRTLNGKAGYHYGYDLAAPKGTPIYAAASGTIAYSGSASGYGLVIYLDSGGGIQSRYGHCSKLLVKKGQKVNKGQIIGLVGNTGRSTGPHLHFEIRKNGTPVDPTKYVKLK